MKIHFNKLLIFSLAVTVLIVTGRQVLALESNQITFPITELGNCTDTTSCKLYCSKPENQLACRTFAQTHQIKPPQPPTGTPDKIQMLSDAKNLLGCATLEACVTFCQKEENRQKCSDFAARERLYARSSSNAPVSPNIIQAFYQATKDELGCDSETSCKTLCAQTQNFTRCTIFAKRHNLFRYSQPATPSARPNPLFQTKPPPPPTVNP